MKGEEKEAFPSRRLSREMSLLFQGGMGFQLVKNHSLPVPGQANPGFQGINPHGVPAALASAGFHMQLWVIQDLQLTRQAQRGGWVPGHRRPHICRGSHTVLREALRSCFRRQAGKQTCFLGWIKTKWLQDEASVLGRKQPLTFGKLDQNVSSEHLGLRITYLGPSQRCERKTDIVKREEKNNIIVARVSGAIIS